MELPVPVHMSGNIANSVSNSIEDQSISLSQSCSEIGNCIPIPHVTAMNKRGILKQIFPYIACIPHDSIIFCFILSVWDNIVGPQTAFVWKRKKKINSPGAFLDKTTFSKLTPEQEHQNVFSASPMNTLSPYSIEDEINLELPWNVHEDIHIHSIKDIHQQVQPKTNGSGPKCNSISQRLNLSTVVRYVTEHSVGVAESNMIQSNNMSFLLLMAPSQNIINLSVKFSIKESGVDVPYCLSAVIPSESESLLLPALNICTDAMLRITAIVRLMISKEGLESGNRVQDSLIELCDTLSSLRDASLTQYSIENFCCKPDDRRFAEQMLTSHLQTMGTTLVIANSPSEANKVVMWLAQFLNEKELSISRIALSDCQWPYQPGITIQAVIRDPSGGIDFSSSKLLCSRRPLSLIDLTTNTVRQMAPINIHCKNSEATFRQQLLALWHDLEHVPAPSQSLFEDVTIVSPLVKRFLHELDRLASCQLEVKTKFIKSFLRSLQYSALAIIVWTRDEWTGECRQREQKSLLQTLMATFLLEEADFKVVLAQAEMLQPGFASLVLE